MLQFQGHEKIINAMIYTDNLVYTAGYDGMVKIWDGTTFKPVASGTTVGTMTVAWGTTVGTMTVAWGTTVGTMTAAVLLNLRE